MLSLRGDRVSHVVKMLRI